MMRYALIAIILMSVLFITGCNPTALDPVAVSPVELPDAYVHQTDTATPETGEENPDDGWWIAFDIDELSELIRTGLGANHDLKVLKARADQALADVRREKATLGPTLDYSLGGEQNYSHSKTRNPSNSSSNHHHSYSAFLDAGYTLDLWGKNRADVNAAELEYFAALEDLDNGALALSTEIADTWVDLVSVRTRIQVLTRQIEANRITLKLLELRYINGMATALDVSQQRQALAQVLSARPLLEKEERQLINAMGLSLGQTPGTPVAVASTDLPQTFLAPQPGIPADLLENRADIRAARMRLEATALNVEAAKADLLPALTLSASAAFSSGTLDLLFQNWVLSLGAALAGPLLDGGDRKAEIERTRAVVREAVSTYAKTVAQALCEVEDALVSIDRQKAYIKLLKQELAAVKVTLQDARVQYLNGQSSYLNYLSAWASMESLERQLVSEQATYVKERIALYKVTGRRKSFFNALQAQDNNTGAK